MSAEKPVVKYAHPSLIQNIINNLSKDDFLPPRAHRPAFYLDTEEGPRGTYYEAEREMRDENRFLDFPYSERAVIETGLHRSGLTQEAARRVLEQSVIMTLPATTEAA